MNATKVTDNIYQLTVNVEDILLKDYGKFKWSC